ncbi:MAG: hypothetical protein A4E30_00172 [Methanomassiliicoccales archaeon PtaB.Bin215]|nr:MAG: hypothetical protein A4E30_00172 [Methanomassiliicoccales archaeon PtaB.Bin215]
MPNISSCGTAVQVTKISSPWGVANRRTDGGGSGTSSQASAGAATARMTVICSTINSTAIGFNTPLLTDI